MKTLIAAGLLFAVLQDPPLIQKTEALSPQEEQKKFHLPPGFKIELVASEPAIQKPLNLAFDDHGRLLVTTTIEYPFPAKGKGRDRLTRLTDTDGDGTYDKVETLADDLNIPIGVAPDGDGVIVFSIPKICRINALGQRRDLYGDVACADTHGLVNHFTAGFDGWFYACHGFTNASNLNGVKMTSGHTFRFRADGSRLEIFTHGQTNPFGLCFDPLGNLYSSDCHSMPAYLLLRGGWYPRFPDNSQDGLGHAPKMLNHLHGSTGIAGIVYYAATQFPPEYRDTIFIGNPVTARVNHDRMECKGSYYRAVQQPDFIRCDDPWFRPVDLQLGPDGCLYIADFYNRIIGHYEVPLDHPGRDRERGRIWRVSFEGNPIKPMPDLTKLNDGELFEMLKDENLAVRLKVTNLLVARKASVKLAAHPWQRAHGLWILERQGTLDDDLVDSLSQDPEAIVRVHLIKALTERKHPPLDLLRNALKDEDAFVRRAAAEALGLHPDLKNIQPLLDAWAPRADTHLVHSIRIALRNQLTLPGAYAGLSGDKIADVSLGVPTPEAAEFLFARPVTPDRLHHMCRYIKPELLPKVLALADSVATLRSANQALQERGLKLPPDVIERASKLAREALNSDDVNQAEQGIRLAVELRLEGLDEELGTLALGRPKMSRLRAPAVEALRSIPILSKILDDAELPMALRQKAAASMGAVSAVELAKHLPSAPDKLALPIAQSLVLSKEGADLLMKAIEAGKASRRLLQDRSVQGRLQALGYALRDLPERDDRIDKIIEARRKAYLNFEPDAAKGAKIFEKTCMVCHQIGNQGKKVGPSLDGIGNRGLDRLLEDVLDPSRIVDLAFRSTTVKTKGGRIYSGLVLREDGEALVMVETQEEVRIPLAEIDKRTVSSLSPMPANFSDALTEEEFLHLLGYLLSQR